MIHEEGIASVPKSTELTGIGMATTYTLPPVRTPGYLPQPLAPSISEETISLWLKLGAMEKLEQAVLDGHSDLLCGRTSRLPQVNKFLRQVPMFQNKIYDIHQAVARGKLREVQQLIDRKKLAFCRDHIGAGILHKAVIFCHKDIIEYLLENYSTILHIRDHQGRTPLHYAAFLPDGGEIYQMLIDAGADANATDVYGHPPEYYIKTEDETMLQELREEYVKYDIQKLKQKKQSVTIRQLQRGYSKPTLGRVQIRDLINKENLEALEDIVLRGHGGLLLGETSTNAAIQEFLTTVPFYLKRIHDVHRAAMRGRLQEITKLLDHRSFAIATDQLGATPLHKAVWYGNYDIVEYIMKTFPLSVNIPDIDGRTPLHYAAVIRDNKEMYNLLLSAGASKAIQDIKGKTADFYVQHPQLLKLDEVIRRNQRINATHMANIINHTRSKIPFRNIPPSMGKDGLSSSTTSDKSGDDELSDLKSDEKDDEQIPNIFDPKIESLIKSLPPLPPLKLQRLEITSGNIRKWMKEEDLDKLKQAVLEGYGDIVLRSNPENVQVHNFLLCTVPGMLEKIHSIHKAVSHNDLSELQTQLDNEELAAAKDSLGMTALHKAVILGHTKIVKFLVDNFPEIINLTDREGRTALHYATAATRKESMNIYRILVQAGADPKVRDLQGRIPDYYRTHRMPTNLKSTLKTKPSPSALLSQSESTARFTKQGVLEKITSALQKSDIDMLKEIVLEGYGKYLIGKTSWNDDVRQYIKSVPHYLSTIRSLQEAVIAGDLNTTEKRITEDEKLLKSKDETGATPIHLAVSNNQEEIVTFFANNYPSVLNMKDNAGRTPLHLAALEGNTELLRIMREKGADPMILDQKGRTAEYYISDKETPYTPFGDSRIDFIDSQPSEIKEMTADDANTTEKEPTPEEAVLNNNTDEPTSEQSNEAVEENTENNTNEAAEENTENNTNEAEEENTENNTNEAAEENTENNINEGAEENTENDKNEETEENNSNEETAEQAPTSIAADEEVKTTESNDEQDFTRQNSNNAEEEEKTENDLNESKDNSNQENVSEEILPKNDDNIENKETENEKTETNLENSETANNTATEDNVVESTENNITSEDTKLEENIENVIAAEDISPPEDATNMEETVQESANSTQNDDNAATETPDKNATDEKSEVTEKKETEKENDITPSEEAKPETETVAGNEENTTDNQKENNKQEENNEKIEESETVEKLTDDDSTKENKDEIPGEENNRTASPANENEKNVESTENQNTEINENHKTDENPVTTNEITNNETTSKPVSAVQGRNHIATKSSSGSRKNRSSGNRNSAQKDYLDELIEQWIKDGDLLRLEHVVLAGQGDRLIEKTSEDKQVQDFLDLVPIYTAKIRAIHEAVIRGNLREVRAVLTRKRFALSRDHVGASPLHLAILHGHTDVVQYIITHFPETMDGPDNEGRTPLHYAAVIPDGGRLYKMVKNQGADENIKDKMGNTPKYYFENSGQLTVQDLWDAYRNGDEQ